MRPRVLITREPEKAAELMRLLQLGGYEVNAIPVTKIARFAEVRDMPDLRQYHWLAFTSGNAVSVFAELLRRSDALLPRSCQIAAVGDATAERVHQELFREAALVSRPASGSALAQALLSLNLPDTTRILYPCARETSSDFSSILGESGVEVCSWVIYATTAVNPVTLKEALWTISPWDAVVFAAPSAVRAFEAAWPVPWAFSAIAIGTTTGHALRHMNGVTLVQANATSPHDQMQALNRALHLTGSLGELEVFHA